MAAAIFYLSRTNKEGFLLGLTGLRWKDAWLCFARMNLLYF